MIDNDFLEGIAEVKKTYQAIKEYASKVPSYRIFGNCENFFLHGETYFKEGSFSENIADRLICSSSLLLELEKKFSKIDKLLKKRNNDASLIENYNEIISMLDVFIVNDDSNEKVLIFEESDFFEKNVKPIFESLSFFLFASDVRGHCDAISSVLKKKGGKEFLEKKEARFYEYLDRVLVGMEVDCSNFFVLMQTNPPKDATRLFIHNIYYAFLCLENLIEIGEGFNDRRVIDEIKKYRPLFLDTIDSLVEHYGFKDISPYSSSFAKWQTLEDCAYIRERDRILSIEKRHAQLFEKFRKDITMKQNTNITDEQKAQENTQKNGIQIVKKADFVFDRQKGQKTPPLKTPTYLGYDEPIISKPLESAIEDISQKALRKAEFKASHFATLVERVEYLRTSMGLTSLSAKSHYFNLFFNGAKIDSRNKEVFLDKVCNAVIINIMCGYYNPSDFDRIQYIQMSHDEKVDALAMSYKGNIKRLFEVILNLGYHPRLAVTEKLREMISRGICLKDSQWVFPPLALDDEEAFTRYKEESFGSTPIKTKKLMDKWVFSNRIGEEIEIKRLYIPRYSECLLS